MNLPKGSSEALVLSIRPRFAEAILDGRKTVEVRRQRPNVQPGTVGLVYSSSPIKAVVGLLRIGGIFSGSPEELWETVHSGAYISKQDFDSYFAGVKYGHAIAVSCAYRFDSPIQLSHLRVIWPGCRPPRSFGYLVAADAYSRRIMSKFWSRLFVEDELGEEHGQNNEDSNRLQDRKGSYTLKWEQVRTLVSLLRSGGG